MRSRKVFNDKGFKVAGPPRHIGATPRKVCQLCGVLIARAKIFVILGSYASYNRWICILRLYIESFQSGQYTVCQGSQKKAAYSIRGRICIQSVHFHFSYVGTGKPTITLWVTVHAPMTSLKDHFLNRKLITESILRFFCHKASWMFVVKQVPVCNFILLIFACVVLRKMHVHSLFTLETVGFPEGLLLLDSDND